MTQQQCHRATPARQDSICVHQVLHLQHKTGSMCTVLRLPCKVNRQPDALQPHFTHPPGWGPIFSYAQNAAPVLQKMVHLQQNAGPAMQHSQGPAAAELKRAPPIPRKSYRRTPGAATANRKIDCVCVKWVVCLGESMCEMIHALGNNLLLVCVLGAVCKRERNESVKCVYFWKIYGWRVRGRRKGENEAVLGADFKTILIMLLLHAITTIAFFLHFYQFF